MLVKRVILAGAGAAIILAGAAMAVDNIAQEQAQQSVGGAEVAPAVSGRSAPLIPVAPSSSLPQQATATAGPDGSGDMPGRNGTGSQRALEVLPPAASSPTGLPAPSRPPALVTVPLPAAASARGRTVEGFPSHVLTFPDGTVLIFTGVSSSGNTLQATAEGVVDLAPEKVAAHFQQVLQSSGFRTEDAPAVAARETLRLTRSNDSVSLSFSTTGTGSSRFSLLANFHADPVP